MMKPGGGLYFVNTQFRTLEPALEKIIEEFDFKKFDLCAWMIGRKFNWLENTTLLDYQYENQARQVIRKLDVFNPDAVKKLITVYKELASHKIQCILIQDDFTLRYNEGFSNWGKAKFTTLTGKPAREELMMQKNTPYNLNWNRVKVNQLNTVLKQIVQNCKSVNSGIKVGINIYYETPLYIKRSEAWYGHNLSEIVETGVDYIYLMSYHRQVKDEMRLSETRSRALFKEIVEKAYQICKEKLIVKLQTRDWNTSEQIPADEVKAYLNLIPPQVHRVCFTPVTPDDLDYLEYILGVSTKHTKTTKRKITMPLSKKAVKIGSHEDKRRRKEGKKVRQGVGTRFIASENNQPVGT
ncbi:poly-beta-1,6-N-acetyl-D-glucosamine N-deacetylase PgaB [Acidobacteriota bacterium]